MSDPIIDKGQNIKSEGRPEVIPVIPVTEMMVREARGEMERYVQCFRQSSGTDVAPEFRQLDPEAMRMTSVHFGLISGEERDNLVGFLNTEATKKGGVRIEPKDGRYNLADQARVVGEYIYNVSGLRDQNIGNSPEATARTIAMKTAMYGEPKPGQISQYLGGFENKPFFPEAGSKFEAFTDRLAVDLEETRLAVSGQVTARAVELADRAKAGDPEALKMLAIYKELARISQRRTQEASEVKFTQDLRENTVRAGMLRAPTDLTTEEMVERDARERAAMMVNASVVKEGMVKEASDPELWNRVLKKQMVLREGERSESGSGGEAMVREAVAINGGEAKKYYQSGETSEGLVRAAGELQVPVEEVARQAGAMTLAKYDMAIVKLARDKSAEAKWRNFKRQKEAVLAQNGGVLLPVGKEITITIDCGGKKESIPADSSVLAAEMKLFGEDEVEEAVVSAMYKETPQAKKDAMSRIGWYADMRTCMDKLKQGAEQGGEIKLIIANDADQAGWVRRLETFDRLLRPGEDAATRQVWESMDAVGLTVAEREAVLAEVKQLHDLATPVVETYEKTVLQPRREEQERQTRAALEGATKEKPSGGLFGALKRVLGNR